MPGRWPMRYLICQPSLVEHMQRPYSRSEGYSHATAERAQPCRSGRRSAVKVR
jgi:hypothetical protein